jgi:CYTH domain-containing protein
MAIEIDQGQRKMCVEIERRFLVENDDWKKEVRYIPPEQPIDPYSGEYGGSDIVQAYFRTTEDTAIRIRIVDGEEAFLTVKAPKQEMERFEFEYEIPLEHAQTMIGNIKMDTLMKRRFCIRLGNVVWEVDEFLGKNNGLVIAEVELKSLDQKIEKPSWVGTEVTGGSRYSNKVLAMFPIRWDK